MTCRALPVCLLAAILAVYPRPIQAQQWLEMKSFIWLEAVVLPGGAVGPINVTKCDLKSRLQDSTNKDDAELRAALLRSKFKPGACSETFGLDAAAVNAMKQWRFEPGKRDGIAIPVMVEVEMNFTLR
jgi:hypothetical protein